MFKTFVETVFSDAPGTQWVKHGLYRLSNARNNMQLIKRTWSQTISPGTSIIMSILLDKRFAKRLMTSGACCPSSKCSGTLERKNGSLWLYWWVFEPQIHRCPLMKYSLKCEKEIFEPKVQRPAFREQPNTSAVLRADVNTLTPFTGSSLLRDDVKHSDASLNPEDIIHFKRIAQL
jgi:hypothetical protein